MYKPGNEEEFRTLLIRTIGKQAHVCPIESHARTPGVPDLNVCQCGTEVWYELKFQAEGRKSHSLTPNQVRWITDRRRSGGRVFLIMCHQVPDRGPKYYVVNGRYAEEIHKQNGAPNWRRLARGQEFDNMGELVQWMLT